METDRSIETVLKQIIFQFALGSFAVGSYGAGNCLNLLNQLQADLTGLDLTGLSIRQADLRDVSLAQVNLAKANLATSLFAESIGDIYQVVISPDDRFDLEARHQVVGRVQHQQAETLDTSD